MGHPLINPVVEFDGARYTLCPSGHYRGYWRKTTGDREMLHRANWIKHNGEIPRRHDVRYRNGNPNDNRPENLDCVNRNDGQRMYGAHKKIPSVFGTKSCLACGRDLWRREGWNHHEAPSAYKRRKTCSPQCSARWKKGKARGTRMPS